MKKSLLLLLFSALLISCGEEPYRLSVSDRMIIDTTTSKQIEIMTRSLEDTCRAHFEGDVKRLTDSLIEFQIKEIDKKLQRNNY